jgi:hypothetical protein
LWDPRLLVARTGSNLDPFLFVDISQDNVCQWPAREKRTSSRASANSTNSSVALAREGRPLRNGWHVRTRKDLVARKVVELRCPELDDFARALYLLTDVRIGQKGVLLPVVERPVHRQHSDCFRGGSQSVCMVCHRPSKTSRSGCRGVRGGQGSPASSVSTAPDSRRARHQGCQELPGPSPGPGAAQTRTYPAAHDESGRAGQPRVRIEGPPLQSRASARP